MDNQSCTKKDWGELHW